MVVNPVRLKMRSSFELIETTVPTKLTPIHRDESRRGGWWSRFAMDYVEDASEVECLAPGEVPSQPKIKRITRGR